MDYKIIENELMSIYEAENKERLVNARELHEKLGNKRKFAEWIKQRINQINLLQTKLLSAFTVKADKSKYIIR